MSIFDDDEMVQFEYFEEIERAHDRACVVINSGRDMPSPWGKYLVKVRGAGQAWSVAHFWNGERTACGKDMKHPDTYDVMDNPKDKDICEMCMWNAGELVINEKYKGRYAKAVPFPESAT